MFNNAAIKLKASMEAGNAQSAVQKSDTKLNSFVQSLTLVDEFGDEVLVKNLPYYIEIMVESQNPSKPQELITAFQSQSDAFKMKPLKVEVSQNSAVFISAEQLFDFKGTQYEVPGNDSCDPLNKTCSGSASNISLPIGTKFVPLQQLDITEEPVVYLVFFNRDGKFPSEQTFNADNLACVLPRDIVEYELGDIASTTEATTKPTTTSAGIDDNSTTTVQFLTTTVGPNIATAIPFDGSQMMTTIPPSQRPPPTKNSGEKKKECKKNKKLPSNTCFFGNDVVNMT